MLWRLVHPWFGGDPPAKSFVAQVAWLRRRARQLEIMEEKTQEKGQTEELGGLRRSVQQLAAQQEHLGHKAEGLQGALAERRELRAAAQELAEGHRALAEGLSDDLRLRAARTGQLAQATERAKRELRERQRERRALHAKIGRLEAHLQALAAQRGVAGPVPGGGGPDGSAATEAQGRAATAREAAAGAKAWTACLPQEVRERAELGPRFEVVCALHRCLRKSQLLGSSIHEHFVEDAVLGTQQAAATMRLLCRICLSSAQVACAMAGVLGRLHAADVGSYARLIRSPALCACAGGEAALDEGIGAVCGLLGEASGDTEERWGSAGLKDVLAALQAQGAQIRSLQMSVFQDQPFASRECTRHAIEALRAACGLALCASDDASGTRPQRWRQLYERSDRLAQELAVGGACGCLLAVEPAAAEPPGLPAADEFGQANTSSEEGQEDMAGLTAGAGAGARGRLSQHLLDGLLQQASALGDAAVSGPGADEDEALALDRAFGLAESCVGSVEAWLEAGAAATGGPAAPSPPWARARDAVRLEIEAALRDVPAEKAEAERLLEAVTRECEAAEASLSSERDGVAAMEREFGAARAEAERNGLEEAAVARMRGQTLSGEDLRRQLAEELEQEQVRAAEADGAAAETRRQCLELQQQLAAAERRLRKRLSSQVPAADVLALRRTCSRQRADAEALARRSSADGASWGDAVEDGVSACWREMRQTQTELLLEQAATTLVSLDEPEPEAAPEAQRRRLRSLGGRSSELRKRVTALLRRVADAGAADTGPARFDSPHLVRYLRASAAAARQGPAARVSLPAGGARAGAAAAVPVAADPAQLLSVHHALL